MKIYLGMPVYSGVHPETVRNLVAFDLDSQREKNELILHFPRSSILTLSRNLIVRKAIEVNADWVLMWDADIEIKDNDFLHRMVAAAYQHNTPVVGLPCRLKNNDEILFNFASKVGKEYNNAREIPQAPQETDVIGTGVMLINVAWIKNNWPISPWFEVIDTLTGAFPEDWNFCEKVRQRGGKVLVYPIKTVHWGEIGYGF